MAGDDLADKLGKYFARFGKARDARIMPDDVARIIVKLEARCDELHAELASATGKKHARLTQKHDAARRMLERARWLLAEVQPQHDDTAPEDGTDPG